MFMTSEDLTVVLVNEDNRLVGYDMVHMYNTDISEKLAASIFRVSTWHHIPD
jgi:hypothetical protein